MYLDTMRIVRELPPEAYYAALPVVRALRGMDFFRFNAPVTMFVGENGSGKSTLIEALANKFKINAEGGTKGRYFSTKYAAPGLAKYIEVEKGETAIDPYFMRAESLYNLASYIDAKGDTDDYGGRSLHEQSHGESFLSLIQNRLYRGLCFFDEPEAALSPMRQMTFLAEMHRLVQAGSQLILATHSPIIMAFPGAELYELTEEGIELIAWEDTDHVRVMKRFLNNRQGMLRILFEE